MPAEPRLAAGLWVSALLRRAFTMGEWGAVLRRGDPVAGAILLVTRARSGNTAVYGRVSGLAESRWHCAARSGPEDSEAVDKYIAAQQRYDEDLWVVELVTEDISQLIDETIAER